MSAEDPSQNGIDGSIKPKCQAQIWDEYHYRRCTRRAAVDGKWCKQHAPAPIADGEPWFIVARCAVQEVRCIRKPKTLKVVQGEEFVGWSSSLSLYECPLRETRVEAVEHHLQIMLKRQRDAAAALRRADEAVKDAERLLAHEQEADQ